MFWENGTGQIRAVFPKRSLLCVLEELAILSALSAPLVPWAGISEPAVLLIERALGHSSGMPKSRI